MTQVDAAPATQATARPPVPYPRHRVLLALDCGGITPKGLSTALKHFLQFTDRLDILLVNPPAAPTSLLCGLLLNLEEYCIDYRLTSTEGDLGEQVLLYLKRFLSISMVLVDRLSPLERTISVAMKRMCSEGYRFVPIAFDESKPAKLQPTRREE